MNIIKWSQFTYHLSSTALFLWIRPIDSKSLQLCSSIPFQLWSNWKVVKLSQNFWIDPKMIQFIFQIHKNSHPFDDISSKIWEFQIIRAQFQIIPVQFQKFLRNSSYFRLFQMIQSVFRKVPTSSTCIRKNSTSSGWLPVNVISVRSSSGQCRISLFVFWSVLPLRAPKMLYV